MMMAASTSTPIEIAMPPRDMMFAPIPWIFMMMNARRIETGIEIIATSAERKWNQKDQADQCHHDRFLEQGVGQRLHGPIDQAGSVVGDGDLDILRKACLELLEALLHALDHRSRIGPPANNDNASDGLALHRSTRPDRDGSRVRW